MCDCVLTISLVDDEVHSIIDNKQLNHVITIGEFQVILIKVDSNNKQITYLPVPARLSFICAHQLRSVTCLLLLATVLATNDSPK